MSAGSLSEFAMPLKAISEKTSLFITKLEQAWSVNNSLLCVGIDPLLDRLPTSLQPSKHNVFAFSKAIINATAPYCCAFKPQIAHYAAFGIEDQLELTIDWIRTTWPQHLIILDAKRGDIGSTAELYAQEVFCRYNADAVTLNPYFGGDALMPFLSYADRGCFILCRTSNPGSLEIQQHGEPPLYLQIAHAITSRWNNNGNAALVVGATWPEELGKVRQEAPELPILVPGIGAQQGDLQAVLRQGLNQAGTGLLINASRSLLYASSGTDFAEAAGIQAKILHQHINTLRCKL